MNACITSFCSTHVVVLLGDFNFPSLRGLLEIVAPSDDMSSRFLDTVQSLSLTQLNTHPSRESTPNILDLVFCQSYCQDIFSKISCA